MWHPGHSRLPSFFDELHQVRHETDCGTTLTLSPLCKGLLIVALTEIFRFLSMYLLNVDPQISAVDIGRPGETLKTVFGLLNMYRLQNKIDNFGQVVQHAYHNLYINEVALRQILQAFRYKYTELVSRLTGSVTSFPPIMNRRAEIQRTMNRQQ